MLFFGKGYEFCPLVAHTSGKRAGWAAVIDKTWSIFEALFSPSGTVGHASTFRGGFLEAHPGGEAIDGLNLCTVPFVSFVQSFVRFVPKLRASQSRVYVKSIATKYVIRGWREQQRGGIVCFYIPSLLGPTSTTALTNFSTSIHSSLRATTTTAQQ